MPADEREDEASLCFSDDSEQSRGMQEKPKDFSREKRLELYEGREDYYDVRRRLQHRTPVRSLQGEVDRFKQQMQVWGHGQIALAWRRSFDVQGNGELSFKDFCNSMAAMGYKADIPGLWHALRSDAEVDSLSLQDLDPVGAGILEAFSLWCAETCGGLTEAFKAMDSDGSGSITKRGFARALTDLGFFKSPKLLASLCCEEFVLKNLYPLLDQNGSGCITPSQLIFLEKDRDKRDKIERQLARIRDYGIQAAPEPLRNDAQRLLFRLSMSTTLMGGKHWKKVRSPVAIGDNESVSFKKSDWSNAGMDFIAAARTPLSPGVLNRRSASVPSFLDSENGRPPSPPPDWRSPPWTPSLRRLRSAPSVQP
ncbi:unnamed protein product, partial [Polarella glacialis]